jgi:hypothetical protein
MVFADPFGLETCAPGDSCAQAGADSTPRQPVTKVLSYSWWLGAGQAGGLTVGLAGDGATAMLFANFDFGVGAGVSGGVSAGAYVGDVSVVEGQLETRANSDGLFWSQKNATAISYNVRGTLVGFSVSIPAPGQGLRGAGGAASLGAGVGAAAMQPHTIAKVRFPIWAPASYSCAKAGFNC